MLAQCILHIVNEEEERLKRHAELIKLAEDQDREQQELDPLSIELPRTEVVPGTIPQFLRRLRSITAHFALRHFPTEDGYFHLQGVRTEDLQAGDPNATPVIAFDGILRQHDGGAILHSRLIYFTIYELKGGNLAVQAICTHPALAEAYHSILRELGWTS
jgi:hypothetical protein